MALSKITNASVADTAVHGRRNLILNGSFAISQRGSSVSVGSGTYTLDRWRTDRDGTVTATVSQQSFTLGQTDVPNEPKHYLRLDITAASGSSYTNLAQFIEGVRNGAGQAVTLSFWAKASSSQTIGLRAIQDFGGSGSADVSQTISSISATTSWQQFTRTFTLASISGKSIGGGNDSLRILWDLPVNTVMQLDLAQVQLEIGDQATPFEHRSYGEELALCQRYYYVLADGGNVDSSKFGTGYGFSSSQAEVVVKFPTQLRAAPTLRQGSGGSDYRYDSGSGAFNFGSYILYQGVITDCLLYKPGLSGVSTGKAYRAQLNATSAYLHFDAEL